MRAARFSFLFLGLFFPALLTTGSAADEIMPLKVERAEASTGALGTAPGGLDAEPTILIWLDKESSVRLTDWMSRHIDETVDFMIDNKVVMRTMDSGRWNVEKMIILSTDSPERAELAGRLNDGRSFLSVKDDPLFSKPAPRK